MPENFGGEFHFEPPSLAFPLNHLAAQVMAFMCARRPAGALAALLKTSFPIDRTRGLHILERICIVSRQRPLDIIIRNATLRDRKRIRSTSRSRRTRSLRFSLRSPEKARCEIDAAGYKPN